MPPGIKFGIADRYLDYRDVLARDDIDVVTIATPNSSHEPITIAALQAGKHVLCEKPLLCRSTRRGGWPRRRGSPAA